MGYAKKQIHHTPEEYLAMERQAIERSQYIDGQIFAMAGESLDRGGKFLRYRTHLDTLSDYVLLSTDRYLVEHFQRQADGLWLYAGIEGLQANLELPSIGCRLPLAEIYDRVEWFEEE